MTNAPPAEPVHGDQTTATWRPVVAPSPTTAPDRFRPRPSVPTRPGGLPTASAFRPRVAVTPLITDYSYVKHDLLRIGLLALGALICLVVISFLLPHWLT